MMHDDRADVVEYHYDIMQLSIMEPYIHLKCHVISNIRKGCS